ncbi:hypothetical protein ALI144C_30705 [Actinosynnema sp. ALI-1.44]|uniref:DUF6292 family protein n=1 Tax=Actinosynnema sp. ALI-1.44 TaxID=1933779 RepID=UPI00097C8E73|nr:DUF6292 family protein [Actinosynnema sp. ALI-1.44]ONI77810.1 hypothetical protein ALI144C_30705 [Actinosynnema sp. ALI-1.44]
MTHLWPAEDRNWEMSLGLAGYLRAVADAVGVPDEGTTFEISDTATAYLALARRWPARPGRDLMLVWSERTGWAVSVETDPGEAPITIARLHGDPLSKPGTVARFVVDAIDHSRAGAPSLPTSAPSNRTVLARGLACYIT